MNTAFFSKRFSFTDDPQNELGFVALEHLWADVYGLKIKWTEKHPSNVQWTTAIREALDEAQIKGARLVSFRLIKNERSGEVGELLPSLGFKKKNERVEFKRTLDLLPDDNGSPMFWKDAEQLSWRPDDIAKVLSLVAEGDPDADPTDDPLLFIQDFLADPVLTSGLNCIHFGFVENEVAAMTVVQINPTSGWSRISYMGIAPKFRGVGLGKWVHRYSFQKMRALGGKLYHGGTVSTNLPMIGLFKMHGCEQIHEMQEWVFTTKRGAL